MPKSTETPDVRVGQVWADNDQRSAGRTLRIEAIEGDEAVCVILTNTTRAQEDLDRRGGSSPWFQDTRGRITRISPSRFRPSSTGYVLVRDAPSAPAPDLSG